MVRLLGAVHPRQKNVRVCRQHTTDLYLLTCVLGESFSMLQSIYFAVVLKEHTEGVSDVSELDAPLF